MYILRHLSSNVLFMHLFIVQPYFFHGKTRFINTSLLTRIEFNVIAQRMKTIMSNTVRFLKYLSICVDFIPTQLEPFPK